MKKLKKMLGKKYKFGSLKVTGTTIAIVALIVIVIYGGTQGWFRTNIENTTNLQQIVPKPSDVKTEFSTYDVSLSVKPLDVCAGDMIVGKLSTNIPNGACTIFRDRGAGWEIFSNVQLDANGKYSENKLITAVEINVIQAVCCDSENNCKKSNQLTMTCTSCDTDNDGIPDETDPDDDNDSYSDEQEIEAGTDPKDFESRPAEEISDCDSKCKAEGYANGRGPVDSGVYCTYLETPIYLSGNAGDMCCCTPHSEGGTICSGLIPDADYDPIFGYIYNNGACDCPSGTVNTMVNPDEFMCISASNPPYYSTCFDDDYGSILTTKGTGAYHSLIETDTCSPGDYTHRNVREVICLEDGTLSSFDVSCPIGQTCSNGACS